jgi:hypothetical protein
MHAIFAWDVCTDYKNDKKLFIHSSNTLHMDDGNYKGCKNLGGRTCKGDKEWINKIYQILVAVYSSRQPNTQRVFRRPCGIIYSQGGRVIVVAVKTPARTCCELSLLLGCARGARRVHPCRLECPALSCQCYRGSEISCVLKLRSLVS